MRGYKTSVDVQLAMERGEVEGYCESLESVLGKRPDWISSGTVNVLLQGGAAPHPDLKGVPYVPDLAKNADDRRAIEFLYAGQGIGRPFFAPPGVPPQVLRMLRDGFNKTMTRSGIRRRGAPAQADARAGERRMPGSADQEDLCDTEARSWTGSRT